MQIADQHAELMAFWGEGRPGASTIESNFRNNLIILVMLPHYLKVLLIINHGLQLIPEVDQSRLLLLEIILDGLAKGLRPADSIFNPGTWVLASIGLITGRFSAIGNSRLLGIGFGVVTG